MTRGPTVLSAVPDPTTLPTRKPMASARRVSLFEREIRIKLSSAALEILFDAAHVLSEGQLATMGYFGSTMITIDVATVAPLVRDECDAATARRVAELVAQDPRVRSRARTLAAAEAAVRAGSKLAKLDVDLRARAQGTKVFLDLDVQGDIARATRGRAGSRTP